MQEQHSNTAIVDALNQWNRRADTPDDNRMRCTATDHGLLIAVPESTSGNGVQWRCPQCARVHPVREQHLTLALGTENLPDLTDTRHDNEVRIPNGIRGDRNDGSIRIRSTIGGGGVEISGPALIAGLLGFVGGGYFGLTDIVPGLALHGVFTAFISALVGLGVGMVAGEAISSWIFPASRAERYTLRRADQLQPGDWVATRPGDQPSARATRVIQITGLSLNNPRYPGIRVTLLTGDTLDCPLDEPWRVLTLH